MKIYTFELKKPKCKTVELCPSPEKKSLPKPVYQKTSFRVLINRRKGCNNPPY